jgi:DNA-binding NarL/FixJ family response regulator
MTERLLKGLTNINGQENTSPLADEISTKALELLRLMAGEYSNREISVAIHSSEGTVINQVSSIFENSIRIR